MYGTPFRDEPRSLGDPTEAVRHTNGVVRPTIPVPRGPLPHRPVSGTHGPDIHDGRDARVLWFHWRQTVRVFRGGMSGARPRHPPLVVGGAWLPW